MKKIYRIISVFLFIFLFEFIFILFSNISFNNILYKILFSLLSAFIINLLFVFKNKSNKIIYFTIMGMLGIFYLVEFMYYDIFNNLLSIESLFNSSDLSKFSSSIFSVIISNWYVILSYLSIFILFFIVLKNDFFERFNKKNYIINISGVIFIYLILLISIYVNNSSLYSPRNLILMFLERILKHLGF